MVQPRASLLGLPLELRREIWRFCCYLPQDDYDDDYDPDRTLWVTKSLDVVPAITTVCRQMREEASPFMPNVVPRFRNPNSYREWASRGPHQTVFMKELSCTWMSGLCNAEGMTSFEPEFVTLPKLERLRLIADGGLSYKHREAPQLFLRQASKYIFNLKELDLTTNIITLQCLDGFRSLTSLSWSGYSWSSPQETLSVLDSLPSLDTVHLRSSESGRGVGRRGPPRERQCSFTPDVLRGLRPLKAFGISHSKPNLPSDFLTSAMLQALSTHRESLDNLTIICYAPVDGPTFEEIQRLKVALKLLSFHLVLDSVSKE